MSAGWATSVDEARNGPHGAQQLLLPLRGGLRRAGGAVDGALHVDRCRVDELRRTEAGPLLGPGAVHV